MGNFFVELCWTDNDWPNLPSSKDSFNSGKSGQKEITDSFPHFCTAPYYVHSRRRDDDNHFRRTHTHPPEVVWEGNRVRITTLLSTSGYIVRMRRFTSHVPSPSTAPFIVQRDHLRQMFVCDAKGDELNIYCNKRRAEDWTPPPPLSLPIYSLCLRRNFCDHLQVQGMIIIRNSQQALTAIHIFHPLIWFRISLNSWKGSSGVHWFRNVYMKYRYDQRGHPSQASNNIREACHGWILRIDKTR